MKDQDSKNMWLDYNYDRNELLRESLDREIARREQLLTEDAFEEGGERVYDDLVGGDEPGSQQGTIERYKFLISDTLGADRIDDGASLLQDRSLGQSAYKFAKGILKELIQADLSDEGKIEAWLAKLIPTTGPREFGFTQQQQNNLSMFFKQVMHKLFMIADVNGDEQVDREIEYILVAFDELEGMDPDDISRISMTRLNDPE